MCCHPVLRPFRARRVPGRFNHNPTQANTAGFLSYDTPEPHLSKGSPACTEPTYHTTVQAPQAASATHPTRTHTLDPASEPPRQLPLAFPFFLKHPSFSHAKKHVRLFFTHRLPLLSALCLYFYLNFSFVPPLKAPLLLPCPKLTQAAPSPTSFLCHPLTPPCASAARSTPYRPTSSYKRPHTSFLHTGRRATNTSIQILETPSDFCRTFPHAAPLHQSSPVTPTTLSTTTYFIP